MLARILQWLREVWSKMINQADVKQSIGVDIAISGPLVIALRDWSLMYINKAPWLKDDLRSMNLPAAISAEIARAVTIEMKIKLSGGPRAQFLADMLIPVHDKLRRQVEYGVAKGGLMLKPFVDGDKIAVDFVQADQFYPVSFDASGKITACVFSDQRTVGKWSYTRLEYHTLTAKGYIIKNQAFKASGSSNNQFTSNTLGTKCALTEVEAWTNLAEEATITGISRPLFGYFKYPTANNIDPTSPLGVSCFSRAIELIKQADQQWSDLLWEFDSGKRALYVDVMAFGKDKNDKPILPNKRLYRTIAGVADLSKDDLFEEWSPEFREQNLLNGLEAILRKIEFTCGLAYGTLSNPTVVDKTATELKIAQQRSYATITDTQKALNTALTDLLYAMNIWTTINDLAPKGEYTVTFDFDDSIVVDKDAQFQQDLRLVTTNIMSKVEFRVRNFGEDEITAQAKVDDAAPAPIDPSQGGF
jgi:A118 family predicted phage portal protein